MILLFFIGVLLSVLVCRCRLVHPPASGNALQTYPAPLVYRYDGGFVLSLDFFLFLFSRFFIFYFSLAFYYFVCILFITFIGISEGNRALLYKSSCMVGFVVFLFIFIFINIYLYRYSK